MKPRDKTFSAADPDLDPVMQAAIEDRIYSLLGARQDGATVCPSEVARAVASDAGPWRLLMPHVRQVAQGLARDGRLEVTRRGVQVDATSRGGPVRLGLPGKRDDT